MTNLIEWCVSCCLADNQYLKNIFMKCYTANKQIQAYV